MCVETDPGTKWFCCYKGCDFTTIAWSSAENGLPRLFKFVFLVNKWSAVRSSSSFRVTFLTPCDALGVFGGQAQDCARHLYASPPTPTTRPHVLPSICVMNAENCWMVWQNCSFGRLFDCVWYGWIDKFIGNHVGTRTQLQPRHLTTSHAHGWGRRRTWVVANPGRGWAEKNGREKLFESRGAFFTIDFLLNFIGKEQFRTSVRKRRVDTRTSIT